MSALQYYLVLLPGFNESGGHLADRPEWVSLAKKTRSAIVACTFVTRPKSEGFRHYAAAGFGSGEALETAIVRFSDGLGRPEISRLPLIIYGHSAGGQFAYGFSCYRPGRLMGFVSVKGGIFFPEPVAETYHVPGLLISGEKDLDRRKKAIRRLFESHRAEAAPWCWMEEKGKGHSEADCPKVAVPYIESIIKKGLAGQPSGSHQRLAKRHGIWVDLKNQEIVSDPDMNVENNVSMGWLPEKAVWEKWKILDNGEAKYIHNI